MDSWFTRIFERGFLILNFLHINHDENLKENHTFLMKISKLRVEMLYSSAHYSYKAKS